MTLKEQILSKIDYQTFYRQFIPDLKVNGQGEAKGLCPFHDDTIPSFSVNLERGVFHCFGCGSGGDVFGFYQDLKKVSFKEALKEIGAMLGIDGNSGMSKVVGVFKYYDEAGQLLYWKERIEPGSNGQKKEFFFYHTKDGKKVAGRGGGSISYNLKELVKAEGPIYFVEGEAKADQLIKWGLVSTCLDSGADSPWKDYYLPYFKKKDLIILPDNDSVGLTYAEMIASSLNGHVPSIKVVALPGLPEKGDILDWVKEPGNTKEKFIEIVESSPTWKPDLPKLETIPHKYDPQWPSPLAEEAFHGLAGEFVHLIEPHTEADPAALLVQFLVGFGNVIGRNSYFEVEADRHYLNLFTCLVGETSKGRKGVSIGQVKRVFKDVGPEWIGNFQGGLSSGEGLVWAVRDEIIKKVPIKEGGKITGYQDQIEDEGIKDKRLMVVEAEMASVLRVMGREGNPLSPVIRKAWDDGLLRIMTKNSPAKATDAHISIIGHITREELRRDLTRTESGNGFANRFIWLCVKRSKVLPEGGKTYLVNMNPFLIRLREAIEFGKQAEEIRKDEESKTIWGEVYPDLSEGQPGLLGAVTSRAEAQVMRLACLYALLDKSLLIRKEHLLAALAVWDYAESSAGFIFRDSVGDPVADQIFQALKDKPEGLTRTEISELFGRHQRSERVDHALTTLSKHNLVKNKKMKGETSGRPVEKWFSI